MKLLLAGVVIAGLALAAVALVGTPLLLGDFMVRLFGL